MIEFTCPHCETAIEISDRQAGKKVDCPECDRRVRVPSPKIEDADEPLKKSSGRSRRRAIRCKNCGKDLPVKKGRPAAKCPTCGADQEYPADMLSQPGAPSHEFHGANLVGTLVGGAFGIILGTAFGALLYRDSNALLLWCFLYALGFAFIGCMFGFMAVGYWTRR